MNPADALRDVKGYAAANRISFTRHARQRMRERGAENRDVREALISATACRAEPEDRWFVSGGIDLDGDSLNVVVAIEDGVIVVTIVG